MGNIYIPRQSACTFKLIGYNAYPVEPLLTCQHSTSQIKMNSNLKLVEINMSSLSAYEREQVEAQESTDPLELYIQKIESLAELLGCSEEAAERIILDRIHNLAAS